MRRLFSICLGVVFGAALMWFAFSVHVVKSGEDVFFVRRQKTQLTDFYANVSTWDRAEWDRHPDLKEAVSRSGDPIAIPEVKVDPEALISGAIRHLESVRREREAESVRRQ